MLSGGVEPAEHLQLTCNEASADLIHSHTLYIYFVYIFHMPGIWDYNFSYMVSCLLRVNSLGYGSIHSLLHANPAETSNVSKLVLQF